MAMINPRLAIGASWNPDIFDKSAILSLCYGDPGVGPPPNGNLVKLGFRDVPVPVFDLRQVADLNAPRRFKRTGYGTKLRFEIDLTYETTAGDPPNLYALGTYGAEGTDASLFALASLLGNSTPGISRAAFNITPPYLFLTTNYQAFQEQWLPVEMDPDDGSPPDVSMGPKTILRTMSFALVTRQTFRRVSLTYQPALFTRLPAVSKIASVTYPAVGSGPYTGTVTFTTALDPIANIQDVLLVWYFNLNGIVGGPYRWERWVMTSIAGNRLSATIVSAQPWPGPIGGGTTVPAFYKIQTADQIWRMPVYAITPYTGTLPPSGMTPNANETQLIGGLV
jgi:hypothetical protein